MNRSSDAETALLRLHADVLFHIDANDRLLGVNEERADDPAPRLFLARGRTAHVIWLRADVDEATIEASTKIARNLPAWDGRQSAPAAYESLRALLSAQASITRTWCGPAFYFGERVRVQIDTDVRVIDDSSAHLLERYFPHTESLLAARAPVVGAVIDGSVVSVCFCARKRPAVCEAGVATEERYQNRGLATMVVSVWRDAVENEGRRPLYSTSWDNLASLAIARKLGIIPYAETFSLT